MNILAPIHGTPYIGGEKPALLYVDSSGNQRAVKVNLTAVTAPGVGDDSVDGYAAGSLWLDTVAGVLWICETATEGSAVWRAAGPGVPTGGTAGQLLSKIDSTDYNTQWVMQAPSIAYAIVFGG